MLAAHELATEGPVAEELVDQLPADAAAAERSAGDAELAAGLAEKSVRTLGTIAADDAQLRRTDEKEPRERGAPATAVADAARGGGTTPTGRA